MVQPDVADVVVARGSVESVVALDAQVSADTQAVLAARRAGTNLAVVAESGDRFEPGDVLATFRSAEGMEEIRATAALSVLEVLAGDGEVVDANMPLLVVEVAGLSIEAQSTPEQLYRLQSFTGEAKAQVVNGPGPMNCPLVGQPSRQDDTVRIICAPVGDVVLYPGSPAIMAVDVGSVEDVLVLPLSAVAGSAQRGVVALRTPGGLESREVGLGLSDGTRVEITDGLVEGDTVSGVPPALVLPERPR